MSDESKKGLPNFMKDTPSALLNFQVFHMAWIADALEKMPDTTKAIGA